MKDLKLIAKVYILSNVILGLVLLGLNLPGLDLSNVWMLFFLSALGSLSLIFKVIGATEASHYNITFLVYSFTYFQLGLPATMLVVLVSNLLEWIWHKYPWYIQSFNIGQYLIALVGMDLVYSSLNPDHVLATWTDILAGIAGMAAFTLINHFLVGIVLWVARQEPLSKSGVMKTFPLVLDFTFWSLGAGAALVWYIEPLAVILVLIPLYLIYSTLKVPALERKTEIDPKTGLFNAEYFASTLANELNRAHRFDRPMTVVMADLDLLRNINNTYGHLAGDEVLIGVANILTENLRDYDIISRFGGEEYAILMPETTPEEAFPRIEMIREQIAAHGFAVPTSVTPISASLSFGIAGRDRSDQTPHDIIHNADLALYHAKSKGRNRSFVYSEEGIKDLFRTGDAVPVGETPSLQERIHRGSYQFKPSPLREEPRPQQPENRSKPTPVEEQGREGDPQDLTAPLVALGKKRPTWVSNAYTILVSAVALGLFIYDMFMTPEALRSVDWVGLLLFSALVFLAELFSVDIYVRNTSVSTSAAPLIGGTLLFGPVGALVLSSLISTAAGLKHRSPVKRGVFNASNQLLAGVLFLGAMGYFGYEFIELGYFSQFIAIMLLSVVVYAVTTSLISLGIDLERGIPFRHTWAEKFSWLSPYFLALGVIAFTLVLSYQMIGFVGLLVIMIPLLVLRYSQMMFIKRTSESVEQLNKTNRKLARTTEEISKLNKDLLQVLSYVIDMRDPFILGHSQQVVFYAVKIAERLGLPPERVELIRKGALIHDIGKLGVPESILGKKTPLTNEEFERIKQHVHIGAEIVRQSEALENVVPMVYHHHEHYDGSGYPEGLKGEEIPLEVRILALADSVEAMASDRPYRKGILFEDILKEVKAKQGAHFDPKVVEAFFQIIGEMEKPFVVNSAEYVEMKVNSELRRSLGFESTG
jgi:diguanylate cyclase (GGDEF)-like protein/putative nucleotidyltransferase with HDIG domain